MKKKGMLLLALLLAAALLLSGCGGPPEWEPLTGEQMDSALVMESDLVSRETLKKNGILFEHTNEESYGGYLDWWNQDFRNYLTKHTGTDTPDILAECEQKVDMDQSLYQRNSDMKGEFISTRNSGNNDYYRYEYGLFGDYRAEKLPKLLYPSRQQKWPRKAEDPIRVLLVDGSDCIGVNGKGIMAMSAASRRDVIERAQAIWSGLTAGHPGDFVLVSDPAAADVVIDFYVSYANAGLYGSMPNFVTVLSCHVNLVAVNLFTGKNENLRVSNWPGNSVSIRNGATKIWMKVPAVDTEAAPFMDKILSWYK